MARQCCNRCPWRGAAGTALVASILRANRRLTGALPLVYDEPTSSASRATAPERKARRRRHPPGAHWRATAGGGHGERAAMPLEDVAQPLGSSPGGEEMGRGPPACGRRRDVRMSTVQAGNPDLAGQVYGDAPAGTRPDVSLRGPRQPQDWWRPFVFVGGFFSPRAVPPQRVWSVPLARSKPEPSARGRLI